MIEVFNAIAYAIDNVNKAFTLPAWSTWDYKQSLEDIFNSDIQIDKDLFTEFEIKSIIKILENYEDYKELISFKNSLVETKNPIWVEKYIHKCLILNQANCYIYAVVLFVFLYKILSLWDRNLLKIYYLDKDNHVILVYGNDLKTGIIIDLWLKWWLNNEYGYVGNYENYVKILNETNKFHYFDFIYDPAATEICRNVNFN